MFEDLSLVLQDWVFGVKEGCFFRFKHLGVLDTWKTLLLLVGIVVLWLLDDGFVWGPLWGVVLEKEKGLFGLV